MVDDCIFCKIANSEIPCHKVYEDERYLAFLDINPNTDGMTIVIPKKHYGSYLVEMPDKDYSGFLLICKRIIRQLDKNLGINRTALVFEGMGVNHVHAKLYPMYGVSDDWKPILHPELVFFKEYPGYIITKMGQRADDKRLAEISKRIRGE